jgi:competence protein ComEC
VVQMADGGFVALSLKADALADDCERAALLVTAKPVPQGCAATVIDLARLRSQGAMALRRTGRGFAVEAVRPRGVSRPWAPATETTAEVEPAGTAAGVTLPRAVDATPSESDLQAED